jgi:hypothetical protein
VDDPQRQHGSGLVLGEDAVLVTTPPANVIAGQPRSLCLDLRRGEKQIEGVLGVVEDARAAAR